MSLSAYESEILNEIQSNKKLSQNNLQIIACAGAGKTEFISTRIAYSIADQIVKPKNIVAFTFTERASQELKFRIRSKIRKIIGHQPDIGDLYVGTIHSFAYELLKEFVPGFRVYDVLDSGKRYSFINTISRELYFNELKEWLRINSNKPYGITEQNWVINNFMRAADIVREELLDPAKVTACKSFPLAFEAYEKMLNERRYLDFSGMLYQCVKVLENNSAIKEQVNERFTHITVDEYQDINKIQEKLINLLAGKKTNICIVGDDDQSIYQWRGSTIDNILTFSSRYKNVHKHFLPVNFRSTNGIINIANHIIKKNTKRLPKSMKDSGLQLEKGDTYKLEFHYRDDEIQFIINKIKDLIGTVWVDSNGKKRGLAYSDIAIFFRSVKFDGGAYIDALRDANIPVAVSGIGGLFETPEIDIIFDIFSYLGEFGRRLNNSNYKVPDIANIYQAANAMFLLPSERKFIKIIEEIKESYKSKKRIYLQELYSEILMLLGLNEERIYNDEFDVVMYNLGRFSMIISDYEGTRQYCTYKDINRLCWFIINYAESAYDAGEGEDPTLMINAVQVMTLHSTKGLGFPAVFMPYNIDRKPRATDPGFLNPKKFDFTRYNGSIEDERRLFYVGLTRSKRYLFVTTSIDPGARKRKKEPSSFFKELNNKYFITDIKKDLRYKNKIKPQPSFEEYRFPTSYSELSDYVRCEYDYKLRYIFGFNPVIVQALGYGNQIHNILNQLHKLAQLNSDVPTDEKAAEILLENFSLRYAAKEQEETLRKSALRSVLKYLNLWREDFILSLKSERNFEMDIDNALISGTIDLLKRQNTSDEILEIIDFKTGNNRKLDEELHLQVQLYTIAAKEALDLNVKKAYVHFLDEKKQSRVEILTTPKQLDNAMKTITDSVNGITTRRFRKNPKNKKVCSECDWRKFCSQKK